MIAGWPVAGPTVQPGTRPGGHRKVTARLRLGVLSGPSPKRLSGLCGPVPKIEKFRLDPNHR